MVLSWSLFRSSRLLKLQRNMSSLHSTAASGFTQGSLYDSNRPSYTDEAIGYVTEVFKELQPLSRNEYDILELGAGTGKFTTKFCSLLKPDVKYLATEPSEPFLATLQSYVPSNVKCLLCTADSLPLPNNSVKLVVAAQCFHWFADTKNLQEIYRVMAPGSRFVCLWNNKDWTVPWVKELEDILTKYYDEDTPRAVSGKWKTVIENFPGFNLRDHSFLPGIEMKGSRDFVVGHFSSISVIAKLPDTEKKEALSKFYKVLDSHPDTRNIPEIQVPFKTEIYDVEKVII